MRNGRLRAALQPNHKEILESGIMTFQVRGRELPPNVADLRRVASRRVLLIAVPV